MYVSESEMYIGTLYSYHSTIPIESLMPKDAFSSINKKNALSTLKVVEKR